VKSVTQLISNNFHILYSEVFAERETKEVGLGDVERGYQDLTYFDSTTMQFLQIHQASITTFLKFQTYQQVSLSHLKTIIQFL